MGKQRLRKPVPEAYKQRLQAWALNEKARLGGISERDWADAITKKTGIKVSYTPIHRWLNADTAIKEEMSGNVLLALSRWRGDSSIEYTRAWLWGKKEQSSDQLGTVVAWLKSSAQAEEISEVVRIGVEVLTKKQSVKIQLPAIALKMRGLGIRATTLIERAALLEPEEEEAAILYLTGQSQDIGSALLDDLAFTLEQIEVEHKRQLLKKRRGSTSTEQLELWGTS